MLLFCPAFHENTAQRALLIPPPALSAGSVCAGPSSGADVGGAEEAPEVGGCFWKSANVEHVVWGHQSMNTEPFTAFTAEATCRMELAVPAILPFTGISDMGEPSSSEVSIPRYPIL